MYDLLPLDRGNLSGERIPRELDDVGGKQYYIALVCRRVKRAWLGIRKDSEEILKK